jgi:hypothetical protein
MRQFLSSGVKIGISALVLGLGGCGGGGIDEGMPADTKPGVDPNMMKVNMTPTKVPPSQAATKSAGEPAKK